MWLCELVQFAGHVVYVSMCQQALLPLPLPHWPSPRQRAKLCGSVFQNHPGPKCSKPQSFPNSPYASQWVSQKSKFWDNLKQHLLLQHRNPLKLDLTCFRMHGYFAVSADGYRLGLGIVQMQQACMCLTLDLALSGKQILHKTMCLPLFRSGEQTEFFKAQQISGLCIVLEPHFVAKILDDLPFPRSLYKRNCCTFFPIRPPTSTVELTIRHPNALRATCCWAT